VKPTTQNRLPESSARNEEHPRMEQHPNDLDRALERHGIPSGNVGLLLQVAADVLAAWERSTSWEDWDAWSRSEAATETMGMLEAALETFAPAEGET
jgi:hypothetical protein